MRRTVAGWRIPFRRTRAPSVELRSGRRALRQRRARRCAATFDRLLKFAAGLRDFARAFWLSSPMVSCALLFELRGKRRRRAVRFRESWPRISSPSFVRGIARGRPACVSRSATERRSRSSASRRRCISVRKCGDVALGSVLMRARASSISAGSRPRRLAMSRPADLPGAPRRRT